MILRIEYKLCIYFEPYLASRAIVRAGGSYVWRSVRYDQLVFKVRTMLFMTQAYSITQKTRKTYPHHTGRPPTYILPSIWNFCRSIRLPSHLHSHIRTANRLDPSGFTKTRRCWSFVWFVLKCPGNGKKDQRSDTDCSFAIKNCSFVIGSDADQPMKHW